MLQPTTMYAADINNAHSKQVCSSTHNTQVRMFPRGQRGLEQGNMIRESAATAIVLHPSHVIWVNTYSSRQVVHRSYASTANGFNMQDNYLWMLGDHVVTGVRLSVPCDPKPRHQRAAQAAARRRDIVLDIHT